jgi:N-hydroxyarylamine O-acetyltransferase
MALDLDAYFRRIGHTGAREPTLATLHALAGAHVQSIPFENLDVLLGRPIALDPESLAKKLIHDRRGGYCFEQNGLLLLVLGQLGYRVTPLSARVRWQRPRDFTPPRTHLFLRVELDGTTWLVDAGVGGLSLTCAIRLHHDGEQPTPHETRRIVREGALWFHQVRFETEWLDVCEFTLEEMPPIDRELASWWTSTNSNSKFRQNLAVSRAAPNGIRHTINNREFTTRYHDGRSEKRELATPAELLTVLSEKFGLNFPEDTRFGPAGSVWPS